MHGRDTTMHVSIDISRFGSIQAQTASLHPLLRLSCKIDTCSAFVSVCASEKVSSVSMYVRLCRFTHMMYEFHMFVYIFAIV